MIRFRPNLLFRLCRALAVLAALLPAVSWAASDISRTDQTEVRLIAAATATGDASVLRLGLSFKMKPGWKVYWRTPGPGGFPPEIDWRDSDNVADARMLFPAPLRFSVLGFDTLGYKDEVVYPIVVRLARPGEPLALRVKLRYLTCNEVCVPYDTTLALDLPAGPAASSRWSGLIGRFEAKVPGDGTASGLTIERVTVAGTRAAPVLRVVVRGRAPLVAPDVFVEGPELFEFGAPKLSFSKDRRLAVLTLSGGTPAADPPALAGQALTLTVIDGDRTVEAVAIAEAAPGAVAGGPSLVLILALALLGGLILNLMPCVLPVLSIKLLGLVGHGGADPARVRLRFLASAAGILASFMALAAVAVAVKTAGVAVGWGIQFQQPSFLVAIVLVLTLFAGNLWGLFELRLPGPLADLALGGGDGKGLAGDFATGAFATLLATPCSAPFLGTAVGFALARGAGEIFLVFGALGLGLAAPWLMVAARPRLATRLPAPGPWMVHLKRVLALALGATAVWLITVLVAQTGTASAVLVGALMAVVLVLLWLRRRGVAVLAGGIAPAAVLVAAVAAFAAPVVLRGAPPDATLDDGPIAWQRFAPGEIPALVAQGKTIFVDVTADWCLTCKANKALVLNRGAVAARLAEAPVVAMLADWTRPDEAISAYLTRFGRYGIPFNIVYGPGAPGGIPLPELLTTGAVIKALDRAAAPAARAARENTP